MSGFDRDMAMAEAIARQAAAQGGRAYYVGGIVRDALMGRENKDVDIEVHGLTPAALEAILDGLGERLTMGASFGVYGLRHHGIDIAMPRTERATGRGHRDFAVSVDPFLGVRRAAMRRDFTINAMMRDVLTGEIADPFGGREDIARGVIRHVSDASFGEDPLRVLRAAQFAARFGFRVAPETIALCARMDLSALARERVEGELRKALTKAKMPSIFFETLRDMHQLGTWFAQVEALGERWQDTMAALDAAAEYRERAGNPMGFMLAALLIDMDEGDARALLARITGEIRLTAYALDLSRRAHEPIAACADRPAPPQTNAMLDGACDPDALVLLALALARARGLPADADFLAERLALYRNAMAKPHVTGRDLIDAGLKPGADFSAMLEHAHALRLQGVPKGDALNRTLAYARSLRGEKSP